MQQPAPTSGQPFVQKSSDINIDKVVVVEGSDSVPEFTPESALANALNIDDSPHIPTTSDKLSDWDSEVEDQILHYLQAEPASLPTKEADECVAIHESSDIGLKFMEKQELLKLHMVLCWQISRKFRRQVTR